MLEADKSKEFVGSCNDIFGQTQLEMKASCGEGTLGSRVGRCSKTACTKRMTRLVFICTVIQDILRSAQHVRDGVNADKSDIMMGLLLRPPVCWRTRLAIYGWILWSCVTPLNPQIECVYWPVIHTDSHVLLVDLFFLSVCRLYWNIQPRCRNSSWMCVFKCSV